MIYFFLCNSDQRSTSIQTPLSVVFFNDKSYENLYNYLKIIIKQMIKYMCESKIV